MTPEQKQKIEMEGLPEEEDLDVWSPTLPVEFATPENVQELWNMLYVSKPDGTGFERIIKPDKETLGLEFGNFLRATTYASLLQAGIEKGAITGQDMIEGQLGLENILAK